MPAPTQRAAIDWLETEPVFRGIAARLSGLVELQAQLKRAYPQGALEVLALEGDTLVVAAPHAAAAARLRQLAPSVLAAMRGRGINVTQLRVRVRRTSAAALHRSSVLPRPPIPASAREALKSLRDEVHSESLRTALAGLLRRRAP